MAKDETRLVDESELAALNLQLQDLLKIKTLAIGMKLFEDPEEMMALQGIRTPTKDRHFTTCQLVTQSRITGYTLGISDENLMVGSSCGSVIGLTPPNPSTWDGDSFAGVWFENKEEAHKHQVQMPRVEAGKYKGLAVSPLRTGRLDPPDIVLFYGTPGQIILFINGLQHKNYQRYDFTVTGESACADSWGRALSTRKTSVSLPCFAERRYGGVADDELLIALPPDEFARGVEGLAQLSKNGLRYPIVPYGIQSDPSEGMAFSYPGRGS